MKKIYITPVVETMEMGGSEVLASISGVISEERGIRYGGVDEDGTLDPSAKGRGELDPTEEVPSEQQVWEQGLW